MELPPAPLVTDATTTITSNNEPTSFQELHAAAQRPWHERAYADGPRPVPPPPPPRSRNLTRPPASDQQNEQQPSDHQPSEQQPRRKRQRVPRAKFEKLRDVDWSKRDPQLLDAVTRRIVGDYARCLCVQCTILQREQQPAPAFRCPVRYCGMQFGDFVELFEHQVAEHGRVFPQCRRVRMELFGQERGAVPYPPVTVYVGQQFMHPAFRPTEWSLARVDEEMRTLHAQLFDSKKHHLGALHIWDSFTMAYHQVRQGGLAQLHAQYELALDFYQSSLVHPVATRSFQDGTDTVGSGRNWLLSPELKHATNLTPFRFELQKHEHREQNRGFSYNADDSDDDEALGDASSLLLLETGQRVQDFETSVVPEAIAATTAALPEDVVRRIEAMPPWQRFLEHSDSRVAAAIKMKQEVRTYKDRRCPDCDRRLVKHRPCRCKIVKTRKPKCCKLCGVAGHTRVRCPNKSSANAAELPTVVRCGQCGLLGHTRKICVQEQVFDVSAKQRRP